MFARSLRARTAYGEPWVAIDSTAQPR